MHPDCRLKTIRIGDEKPNHLREAQVVVVIMLVWKCIKEERLRLRF